MTSDPFEIFYLPRRFDLDPKQLHQRFVEAVMASHPDRFSDPVDQAQAAEQSARINHAYQTLRDPEARANCLLQLLGEQAKEDDQALPPQLLMQMMEIRERMEAAIDEKDHRTLDELSQWAQQQRSEHLARIGDCFNQMARNGQSEHDSASRAVRLELNALRYIQRMIEHMPAPPNAPR